MSNKILSNLNCLHVPFFKFFSLLLLLMLASPFVLAQTGVGIKTDLAVYPEGNAPALSSAGTKTTDPVFGTQVLRVTDETNGSDSGTAYSYWSTFNKDSTQILIYGSNPAIQGFDPVSFNLVGPKRAFPSPPGGGFTTSEDAIWSGLDPNKLLVHRGLTIWALNTSTMTYTQVGDVTSSLPAGSYFWQMSVSRDDNVFAFSFRNPDSSFGGYVVWQRSTNRVVYSVNTSDLDEVQIDKTGRYLVVKTGLQGRGIIEVKTVDLQTQVVSDLTDDGPDYAPGHSDNGRGTVIGMDNWDNSLTFRNLANPHVFTRALYWGSNWANGGGHVSFLGDDENWALVSSYNATRSSGTFNNEIYLVATDGSQRVRRFVHHYSYYVANYNNMPRANISRDGKFVAFTSTWGNTNRRDLFIAKVPNTAVTPPWSSVPIGITTKSVQKPTLTPTIMVTRSSNGKSTLTNH